MNNIKYKKLEIKEEKEENIMVIDKTRMVEIKNDFVVFCGATDYVAAERRGAGSFEHKAIYLSSNYEWVLGKEDNGTLCLVPLRIEYI